jgi:hypothetical protein
MEGMKRIPLTLFAVFISIVSLATLSVVAANTRTPSTLAQYLELTNITPEAFIEQGIVPVPGQGVAKDQYGTVKYATEQLILKMSDATKVKDTLAKYELRLIDDSSIPAAPSGLKNTRTLDKWDYYLVQVSNLDNPYLKEYFSRQTATPNTTFDSVVSAKTFTLAQQFRAQGVDRVYLNETATVDPFGVKVSENSVTPSPITLPPVVYGSPNWTESTVAPVTDAWKQITALKPQEQPGTGTQIAVIDFGFDMRNPDLTGQNLYNTTSSYKNTKPEPLGYDFGCKTYLKTGDVTADNEHGTQVSSVALGTANNDYGVAGIAPNARLIALRATEKCETSNLFAWNVIKSIRTADAWGADVINMSFGYYSTFTPGTALMQNALKDAQKHGVINIAAAGNQSRKNGVGDKDKELLYPANFDGVIAVGAAYLKNDTDTNATKADFANYGQYIQLWAPAQTPVTPTETLSKNCYTLNMGCSRYTASTGTGSSFSTAVMSGTAALLKQVDPTIDAGKALLALYQGAATVTGEDGKYPKADAAVRYLIGWTKPIPVPPVITIDPDVTIYRF